MDTFSITIGIAMLAIFVAPFAIMSINKNNTRNDLENICKDNGFNIDEIEKINNVIIAVDRREKRLMRAKLKGKSISTTIIDLNSNNYCQMTGSENEGVSLEIGNKRLTLTKADDGIMANREAMAKAKKWVKILNDMRNM